MPRTHKVIMRTALAISEERSKTTRLRSNLLETAKTNERQMLDRLNADHKIKRQHCLSEIKALRAENAALKSRMTYFLNDNNASRILTIIQTSKDWTRCKDIAIITPFTAQQVHMICMALVASNVIEWNQNEMSASYRALPQKG